MLDISNRTPVSGKTIAVTGASGMLGVYLCRALLDAGANVRGVVRNPLKAAFLGDEGVSFAQADLQDRDALRAAFEGADAIISNAALYSMTNHRWADNYQSNKEGTENVYLAAADAGVKRVVQISTFGVYCLRPGGTALNEDSPVLNGEQREGFAYRATKQLSEAMACDISAQRGIGLTILRPTGIYGARDSNLKPLLKTLLKFPFLPVPAFSFPFVYAADVAQAAVGALENPAATDRVYNTGGDDSNFVTFLLALREALGKRTPYILSIPFPLHFRIDNSRAERELGFRNRSHLDGWRHVLQQEVW
jgi:dihydroflavonol-4-reductase